MNKSIKLGKTETAPQNNQISHVENKEDNNKIITTDHTKSTERSQNDEIQND